MKRLIAILSLAIAGLAAACNPTTSPGGSTEPLSPALSSEPSAAPSVAESPSASPSP
jgi:hypothetical protein